MPRIQQNPETKKAMYELCKLRGMRIQFDRRMKYLWDDLVGWPGVDLPSSCQWVRARHPSYDSLLLWQSAEILPTPIWQVMATGDYNQVAAACAFPPLKIWMIMINFANECTDDDSPSAVITPGAGGVVASGHIRRDISLVMRECNPMRPNMSFDGSRGLG
jgi:hypothetical protein